MDDAGALTDSRAAIKALASDPRCNGQVSVVGVCLGGKYALQLAAEGGVRSSVSFYPVRVTDYQDRLAGLSCPTQVHVGDDDAHIPPPVQKLLAERLSRSEEHTSELQSLMRISYAVFCLKKTKQPPTTKIIHHEQY